MAIHNQTVFYLERLQLDWLPQRRRKTIRVCNWLLFGLLAGLGGGLSVGLALGLVDGLLVGLIVGLIGGSVVGLLGGLYAGSEACLRHAVLRLWLIRDGSTPWSYVRFLDHAADRILLRKVGGGYAFIHRMLLDYFAARYVEPSRGDQLPAKRSSTKDEWQTA
jgi:hypothetical protein